jgi:hypothetical protein
MNSEQFSALSRLMRLRASAAADGLRLVLVDGLSQADAAARSGATRQAVGRGVKSARQCIEDAAVLTGHGAPAHETPPRSLPAQPARREPTVPPPSVRLAR